jgi:A/G-specific adenine glycosylase
VNQFPVRVKKRVSIKRYFYYLIINRSNKIFICQRAENDIWAYLYDFPLIETKKPISIPALLKSENWKKIMGQQDSVIRNISIQYKHILSHQVIFSRFIELDVDKTFQLPSALEIEAADIIHYPVSRLIDMYLQQRVVKAVGINLGI